MTNLPRSEPKSDTSTTSDCHIQLFSRRTGALIIPAPMHEQESDQIPSENGIQSCMLLLLAVTVPRPKHIGKAVLKRCNVGLGFVTGPSSQVGRSLGSTPKLCDGKIRRVDCLPPHIASLLTRRCSDCDATCGISRYQSRACPLCRRCPLQPATKET